MYEGASVVGACSGIPLVYLKTRLGRFCLLIVFGLFKILHVHREVILIKCLYLCLHRSEWLGHPTWYHQEKSRFLYFLLSSHDDMMGKRKGSAIDHRTVLVRVSSAHANRVASFIESIIKKWPQFPILTLHTFLGFAFTAELASFALHT